MYNTNEKSVGPGRRRGRSRKLANVDPGKAIGYLRISKGDAESLSIEAQEKDLNQWCASKGVQLVRIERDVNVSGGKAQEDREGLQQALLGLIQERAGILLVAKRDRLARDALQASLLEQKVMSLGAKIISVDGIGSGDQPTDVFQRQILDSVAELERGMIRARTKRALKVKSDRGERISGKPPYGYEFSSGESGKMHVREVQDEQIVVARIVELRKQGRSYSGIAADLNRENIPARGQQWYPGTIRSICLRDPGAHLASYESRSQALIDASKLDDNMQQWKLHDLFDLDGWFGQRNSADSEILQGYVNEGVVRQDLVEVPIVAADYPSEVFGGLPPHKELCLHAVAWAKQKGYSFTTEAEYPGGKADVLCEYARVAIECGTTSVAKIIVALKHDWSVLVIPYFCTTKSGKMLGAMFSPVGEFEKPDMWGPDNPTRGITDADF